MIIKGKRRILSQEQNKATVPHRATQRVLSILDLLAQAKKSLTFSEIQKSLNIPKSSLSPILHTMVNAEYVQSNEADATYSVGIHAFMAGKAFERSNDDLTMLRRVMQGIVDKTNETCQVGILDHNKVLYLVRIDSPQVIRLVSSPGYLLPAYCTAIGKVLISEWSDERLKELGPEPYDRYTDRTITTREALSEELEKVREYGIARDRSEMTKGVQCIAVSLKVQGSIKYGLGLTVPDYRLTDDKLQEFKQVLKDAQTQLEAMLI